jgi:peptidoglycan DL-endopeptidase CwlS
MRKKRILLVFLVLLLVFSTYSPAFAVTSGDMKVIVNNRVVSLSTQVSNLNGVVLVPAKEFIERLGGTFTYNNTTMTGMAKVGENELSFRLDDSVACFDGKLIQSTAPMKILNCRFMIPAGFTASQLGAVYYLDTRKNTILVFQPVDGKISYNVQAGDTFWILSQLFGTTVNSLKQLNGLTSDMLLVGQNLIIKNTNPFSPILPAYTTAGATIRSGAGFDFSVVGYLGASANINIAGKNGEWYKASTTKGNGYIYSTVIGMKQELSFGPQSGFFNGEIAVDTSMDTVSYMDYTVQRGDSIWAVSQKYGISDYELAAANNLSTTTVLYPAQKLKIPVHNIPVKKTLGPQYGEVLDWFKEAQYIFPIGKTGKLIDIATGKSFMVKRTTGINHSDTEALTAQDSQTMKEIFGGNWNWTRRSFILESDGRRFAVSVAGMPHDGVDGVPFLQVVDNRSDNYGTGPNYDAIAGNGMDGHFDLYFLNCLRHVDNKIDSVHQYNVLASGGLQ